MAFGPRRRSRWSTRCAPSRALRGYHLLPTVRGDLLEKLGRDEEARAEFERAVAVTPNPRQRSALLQRIAGSTNGS